MISRFFSRRIRELERQNADLRALLGKNFDEVSVTRMSFDAEKGFLEADFKAGLGGILASWAYNSLEACGAKNYVEMSMFHPKGGFLTLTVQKRSGETPGAKVARLERELAELRAQKGEAA